ncbi:F-box domain-containing protein [Favolaschia claudopus]|uniref:F-box domain-containing protein n=1 Tax=Favolaschia claudopus TaxID=2862362 RepID=A0AAW0AVU1_9AGAR
MSTSTLPAELFIQIFRILDAKTLLRCCSICRLWNELIQGTTELQYSIELLAEGMVRSASQPEPEMFQLLLTRRRAWQYLEWTSKTTVGIERLSLCIWELVAGVLVEQQKQTASFFAVALTRDNDPVVERSHLSPFDMWDLRDLIIDPTQDLILRFFAPIDQHAYIVCQTLSTEGHHPLAAEPMIRFDLGRLTTNSYVAMDLADDIVSVYFPRPPYSFHLLNWKTGMEIVKIRGDVSTESTLSRSAADFHLLSPRSYIFAHAPSPQTTAAASGGQIDLFTFDGDRFNVPALAATLELPKTFPGTGLLSASIIAGAFCANPVTGAGTPFSKSNEHRIFLFNLCYDFPHWFHLFVPFRAFHQYIVDFARDRQVQVEPWADWGPQNSRMLEGSQQSSHRQVHGERVVFSNEALGRGFVEVLDFGAAAQRRTVARAPVIDDPESDASPSPPSSLSCATQPEVHLEPSVLASESVFVDTIITDLPYSSAVRRLDPESDEFALDQDRLFAFSRAGLYPEVTVYTF